MNTSMTPFQTAFSDELIKQAKYPISRFLTAHTTGLLQALNPLRAGRIPLALVEGATGAGGTSLSRRIGARALEGRLARGGKGLVKHEKKKIAEALGVNVEELENMIRQYASKRGKGASTYPISRLITTKYHPLNLVRRPVGIRGLSGRAQRGGKALTSRERALLADLKASRGRK